MRFSFISDLCEGKKASKIVLPLWSVHSGIVVCHQHHGLKGRLPSVVLCFRYDGQTLAKICVTRYLGILIAGNTILICDANDLTAMICSMIDCFRIIVCVISFAGRPMPRIPSQEYFCEIRTVQHRMRRF